MTYQVKRTTEINLNVGDVITTKDTYFTIPTKGRYRFIVKEGMLIRYMRLG